MKKVAITMMALLVFGQVWCQNLLEKEHGVGSNKLEAFVIDEESGTIQAILKLKSKKGSTEYEQHTYSLNDLSLRESELFKLDTEGSEKRNFFSVRKEEPPMRLVKGENNALGQFVLKKGYFYQKVKSSTVGRWTTTMVKEAFEVEVKEKPKGIDGDKMSMVMYASDAPKYAEYRASYRKVNNINKATGDITAFLYEKEKPFYTKYGVYRWSAEDLSLKSKKAISFSTPYFPICSKVMKDGSMALIFSDPECNPEIPLLYLRVDNDGNELDRIEFKLDISGMHNLWIDEDDAGNTTITGLTHKDLPLVILGVGEITTTQSANYAFNGNRMDFRKPDYLTFIQIRDGKVVYTDQRPVEAHFSTSVIEAGDKLKLPKASKAQDEFKWNKAGFGTFITKNANNKTFVLGQDYNTALHFVAQYDPASGLEKTYFKARELPSGPNQFFHHANDKLYWFMGEVDFEKGATRTEVSMIDPSSSEIKTVFTSSKGFTPSSTNFINFFDNEKGAVLLELGEKGKKLKLTKITF